MTDEIEDQEKLAVSIQLTPEEIEDLREEMKEAGNWLRQKIQAEKNEREQLKK